MRLITRADFDGLACSTLLVEEGLVDDWLFVHPKDVQDGLVAAKPSDIVANLPYIPGCRLWFDHHESDSHNKAAADGASYPAPSCARVIYDFYDGSKRLPAFADMVAAADKIDSANLSINEVLHPAGWVMLGFICDPRTGLGRVRSFAISNIELMKRMAKNTLGHPINEILAIPDIAERIEYSRHTRDHHISTLRENTEIHGNVVKVDLRGMEIPVGNRFIIYALYPRQNVSVVALDGRNCVNTVISVGHSIINRSATSDVGAICARYGGGGHRVVATCQVPNATADKTIDEIVAALQEQ